MRKRLITYCRDPTDVVYFGAHTQNVMNTFTKSFFFIFLISFLYTKSVAQDLTITGIVADTAGITLPGAIVRIRFGEDSAATSTDPYGKFIFNKVKRQPFVLTAGYIGYQSFAKSYTPANGKEQKISTIKLLVLSNTLEGVTISGTPPVKVSEDTVSFSARAFPVREGDGVDEMLKRLPGIEVDKDGNVTSQGTPVTKIRINGKDFFGSDVATAIKNLPADIIQNLQFIDDYGDQAKLSGIKSGEPEKILNLTIQEDKKKGYFARASAGLGNLGRYNVNLRGNSLKGERQLSFDGTLTNANTRGGGGDGITTKRAGGINYKNEFNSKLSADIGYNFNNNKNNTIGTTYTQNFLQGNDNNALTRIEDTRIDNETENYRHRLGGNLEYKIDSANYLKISPNFSFDHNNGNNFGESLISQDTIYTTRTNIEQNRSNNINLRTNIFYNYKFEKQGRNLAAWSNIGYSKDENNRAVLNNYINDNSNLVDTLIQNQNNTQNGNNFQLNLGTSYTEPVWEKGFLEFNYSWNHSGTKNSRLVYDVFPVGPEFNQNLSNLYDYQFTTNKIGVNYRHIGEKLKFTLGLNAQPTILSGKNITNNIETVNKNFNLIPSGRFSYKFSSQRSLEANYRGRNNQPTFLQLQPITDNSNLQNVVTGNPNLRPEFIHSIDLHYKQADWSAGKIILANLRYENINDRIVTTKQRQPGSVNQLTSYTNTDGYYTLRGDYDISYPLSSARRFTIGYSGSAQANNNVSFTDENRIEALNLSWRQELEFRVDIEDVVNLEAEASYSQNRTSYSTDLFSDRRSNRFEYGIEGRTFLFKDLTLGYDFTKQINTGFDNENIRNPTLLRLYTEYRFFKSNLGAIRLEGFDLFNQNAGISRDVFDNVIIDRQVNRLGRYYMVSLIFRIRNFGS